MPKRHVARPTLEPVEVRLAPSSFASFLNPLTQVSTAIAAVTNHNSHTAAKKDTHPAAKETHPAAKQDVHHATPHAARAKPARVHPQAVTTTTHAHHKTSSSSSPSTFDQILKSVFPF